MKSLNVWLQEYGESHQNPTNKKVHFLCVPLIFFTIMALLYSLPISFANLGWIEINVATIIAVLVVVYYISLSPILAFGMFLFTLLCLMVSNAILLATSSKQSLAIISLVLFILAWIIQIWGHKVEGKKPSFLKDLQFLMIGPAWVITFLFKKIGIQP
jgi:uncharacterized membrane protein YGL010W